MQSMATLTAAVYFLGAAGSAQCDAVTAARTSHLPTARRADKGRCGSYKMRILPHALQNTVRFYTVSKYTSCLKAEGG